MMIIIVMVTVLVVVMILVVQNEQGTLLQGCLTSDVAIGRVWITGVEVYDHSETVSLRGLWTRKQYSVYPLG